MCGLIGIAGQGITHWDLDVLNDLCQVIPLRGTDGTGIMQGRTTGFHTTHVTDLIVEKNSFEMTHFKNYHKYHDKGNRELFKGLQNNFFAVHVRAATIGDLSSANAHPFDVGNLVGMHNGTLVDYKYHDNISTDSELMFRDMNERGIKPVLDELDPKSAYAIVVLDKDTGLLHFGRNEQRPLYFCYSAKRSVMYWASEDWMLRSLLARNREEVHKGEFFYFSPNTLYTVNPNDIEKDTSKLERVTIEKNFYKKNFNNVNINKNNKKGRTKPRVKVITRGNVIHLDPKEEKRIPDNVCCGCQQRINLVDRYFARPIGPNIFLCRDCEEQDEKIVHIN